jgi:sugar/nucleoside kinase (ribokinase family)
LESKLKQKKKYHVLGIGNAIVDILANVEYDFLQKLNIRKGIMRLIDEFEVDKLRESIDVVKTVSGGSAANTIVGLASMGHPVAFIGKVRDDELGMSFEKGLKKSGVYYCTPKAESDYPTACCVVMTTPDAQRTMSTCLGISGLLNTRDIDKDAISKSSILYLEGYLWDRDEAKEVFLKAIEIAKKAGGKVALSLSDLHCVNRHRPGFMDLINNYTDIVFGNEDEIKTLLGIYRFDGVVTKCCTIKNIFAITRGAEGSVIISGDEVYNLPAEADVKVVDTNGAGDLYAAGFLHGIIEDMDLESCGKIGNIIAAEVISHMGSRPVSNLAELLKSKGF